MDLIAAIKELTMGPDFFKSALKEKRNVARISCRIDARASLDKEQVALIITDISLSGMRVQCPVMMEHEQVFDISLEAEKISPMESSGLLKKPLRVKVSWCRKPESRQYYVAGLMFSDSDRDLMDSWVHYLLNQFGVDKNTFFSKRQSLRIPAEIPLMLSDDRGRIKQGTIINIGIGGILAQSTKEIAAAESLSITIGPYKKIPSFVLSGEVLRSSYRRSQEKWLMAIEFSSMQRKDYKNVGKLLISLLRESGSL